MKQLICLIIYVCALPISLMAQQRRVENRPYTDLRPFHFGVVVGAHVQDVELFNAGIQHITLDDGQTIETNIAAEQDRYDPGFVVGVTGEMRLNRHFQLRVVPAMYFGNRHLVFRNLGQTDAEGLPIEHRQDMKTAYISTAFNLIFAAPRFNNHRPYVMLGLNPMLNLSGKDNDYIKLKRSDVFVEVGLGCDFYLPYFKLRPELKFMYSLMNSLDKSHAKNLQDKNMLMYTNSVNETRAKMIALTFYFE